MTHEIQQTYVNPTRVYEAIFDVASIFLKVQIHFMQDLHNPKFMRSSPSYVAYNYTSNEVAVCTQELQQTLSSMEKKHKRWYNYWSQVQSESDEYEMTYVANRKYRDQGDTLASNHLQCTILCTQAKFDNSYSTSDAIAVCT